MKRRSMLMTCVCLLLISGQPGHATGVQLAGHPSLLPVGSGTLTWWGVTLYEATLLAPDAHYRPDTPYALQFDIWLDPRTREPDLRRQLLGALE
jgi:hypothetical protein